MGAGKILQGIGQTLQGTSNALMNAEMLKQKAEEQKQQSEILKGRIGMQWLDNTMKLPQSLRKKALMSEKGQQYSTYVFGTPFDEASINMLSDNSMAEMTSQFIPIVGDLMQQGKDGQAIVKTVMNSFKDKDPTMIYTGIQKAVEYHANLKKSLSNEGGIFDSKEFDYNFKDAQNIKQNALSQLNSIRAQVKEHGGKTMGQAFVDSAVSLGYDAGQLNNLMKITVTPTGSVDGIKQVFNLQSQLEKNAPVNQTQGGVPANQTTGATPTTSDTVPIPREQVIKTEKELRDETYRLTKDFKTVKDAVSRVIGTLSSYQGVRKAGPSDVALIYNFMKVLDPGSVVREGEFATASNAGGVDERVRNFYNSLTEGQKITPELRADFARVIKSLYDTQATAYSAETKQYKDLATRYQINPENVVVDVSLPEELNKKFNSLLNANVETLKPSKKVESTLGELKF